MKQKKDQALAVIGNGLSIQKFSPEPKGINIDQLFDDASKTQGLIGDHLAYAVILAITIGRTLNAIASMVPRGQCENMIAERFCKPHSVSIRTAQRYRAIANGTDKLVEALRKLHPDRSGLSDQQLLRSISINEALRLIRGIPNETVEKDPRLHQGPTSDRNDWLTPPAIVDLVVDFLKVVDLDPCAVPGFNPIRALQVISKPIDGLARESSWKGRLYINPGFKGTNYHAWVERALFEYSQGNVEEAVLLLPAHTNSRFALELRNFPRAFTVKSLDVDGPGGQQLIKLPLMLVYVGPQERFAEFAATFNVRDTCDVFVPANCRS